MSLISTQSVKKYNYYKVKVNDAKLKHYGQNLDMVL